MKKILIFTFNIFINSLTICAEKQQINKIIREARAGIKANACVGSKIVKGLEILEAMPKSTFRTNKYEVLQRLLKKAEKICKG